jgi:hypothetical protein
MKLAAILIVLCAMHVRPAEACSKVECPKLVPFATAAEAMTNLGATDVAILAKAAFTLVSSKDPAHLEAVGALLLQPARIAALTKDFCVLPEILARLAANPMPEARAAFIAMTVSKAWNEDPKDGASTIRPQMLLLASGEMRPPTREVVALWKRYVQPGWVNVVVIALGLNHSTESTALFESLLRDTLYDLPNRTEWLRTSYLKHRDQLAMLQMASRLLAKPPAGLAVPIAEATFDYRTNWWGTCGGPPNPPLAGYSPDARKELRAIAKLVSKPDKQLAAAITKAIAELDKLP